MRKSKLIAVCRCVRLLFSHRAHREHRGHGPQPSSSVYSVSSVANLRSHSIDISYKSQKSKVKSEGEFWGRVQRQARFLLFVFCLLPFAFSGCGGKTATAETAPVAVKVKTVEANTASKGVRYAANIRPLKQVELAFKVGGYVERIAQARGVDGRLRDLQPGDIVTKGQVLARVRQSEYAVKVNQAQTQVAESKSSLEASQAQHAEAQSSIQSGKAQLAEADAALEKARLDFDRAQSLFASQSYTKANYDAAKTQFEAATAKRHVAQSQVAMLEAKESAAETQIDIVKARINRAEAVVTEATIPLQDTALRAPINGVVLQRDVEVGALIAAGKPAFIIADLAAVKAIFGVPDLTVGKLKPGSTLTVTTEALPGVELHGQITGIAPAADAKSRVFDVEVTIPNPRGWLKGGMIAALEVAATTLPQPVTVVPVAAIVRAKDKPDQYAVFVVEERGGQQIARSRTVTLGEALGNTMVVLEGVSVGERVITSGATLALDGQAVQIIP